MWILQFPADLVIFTEEILNGKLHFFCSVHFIRSNCRCQCLSAFSYVLQLVCLFNVIFFFIVLSINKRKLPTNNQNLEKDL